LAYSLYHESPDDAFRWVESISDSKGRVQVASNLIYNIRKSDPAAAEHLLSTSQLSDADAQAVVQALQRFDDEAKKRSFQPQSDQ
jgi:hypothetical protein